MRAPTDLKESPAFEQALESGHPTDGALLTEQAPAPPLLIGIGEQVQTWLSELAEQAQLTLRAFRTPAPALSFAGDEAAQRVVLDLASSAGTVNIRIEGDQAVLTVEHPNSEVGTLLLIEAVTAAGEPAWRTFTMLRTGFRRSLALTRIQASLLDGARLSVAPVALQRIPAAAVPLLREAMERARHDDPASLDLWRRWSVLAAQAALEENAHAALKGLASGGGA